jgi:transposase-like protein
MEEIKMNKCTYSAELKTKIVLELLNNEEPINEISNKYEINQSILRKWKNEAVKGIYDKFSKDKNMKLLQKEHNLEIDNLNKKVSDLENEIDWIKKKSKECNISI